MISSDQRPAEAIMSHTSPSTQQLQSDFEEELLEMDKILTDEQLEAAKAIQNMTFLTISVIIIVLVTLLASFCYSVCFSSWMQKLKHRQLPHLNGRRGCRKDVKFSIASTDTTDESSCYTSLDSVNVVTEKDGMIQEKP